jgi:hypothetical protein
MAPGRSVARYVSKFCRTVNDVMDDLFGPGSGVKGMWRAALRCG